MDLRSINSHLLGNHSLQVSEMANAEKILSAQDDCDVLFINYASMAWHEMRRAWRRGNHSPTSQRNLNKQVLSWSTARRDLLSSNEPVEEPIPLSKVVKFLVEVWEEEHL